MHKEGLGKINRNKFKVLFLQLQTILNASLFKVKTNTIVTISLGFDGLLVPLPNNSKLQINELYFKLGNKTDLVMTNNDLR